MTAYRYVIFGEIIIPCCHAAYLLNKDQQTLGRSKDAALKIGQDIN